MANGRARSSGIFSGVLLIAVGTLLLLHNYRELDITPLLTRWWPLIIIVLGLAKLYERTAGRSFDRPSTSRITGQEILLVVALLAIVGMVVGFEKHRNGPGGEFFNEMNGENFPFDANVEPQKVPANARILIRGTRGDISVRSSTDNEIRVSAKKNARAWNEESAQRIADRVRAEIVKNGDGYEVRVAGSDDARISVDLDVTVPEKSAVTIKTEKGDVIVSDVGGALNISDMTGDVEVRGNNGDVDVDIRKGDVKLSDTKGNIKISGKGGAIDATSASGSLTVDGDFFGPIRADKISKGVRCVSGKTDLTLSQLAGHLELGSGNLEILDAPGNLSVNTRDTDVNVENGGGKIRVENRNGRVELRFALPPKEDIEIVNSSSEISLSLPDSASFELQADCQKCDINSEFTGLQQNGDAGDSHHLAGKYGNGRGPKITLKTSYGAISLRRTTGSLPPIPPTPAFPKTPNVPKMPPTKPDEL
ncbi:MAG TPA: DUF4097 family beta strand repeat-containing protein [Candidatus Dormibacteraeota bacterium]|nr:DUF4097 family beta strand repeat-containing protein [Candidatus Dormibacteraeota bacterium]